MKLRTIIITLFMLAATAVHADDIKTVEGVSVFYGESSHSLNDCKRYALEQARIAALAKEFGTNVSQDIYQRDIVSGNTESTYFNMLNSTEVNGEWIADEGEPKYEIGYGNDNLPVVTCRIKGKARKISNVAVEFDAKVLRNGNEERFADTRFREGDEMKVLFRAPVDGYVLIYLVDDSNTAYSLLPYSNSTDGVIRVKRDRDYVFFDAKKADKAFGEPDELLMTLSDGNAVEHNHCYVIFSPQPFTKALDRAGKDLQPRMLAHADFQKGLVNCRKRDPKMGMKVMHLVIEKN